MRAVSHHWHLRSHAAVRTQVELAHAVLLKAACEVCVASAVVDDEAAHKVHLRPRDCRMVHYCLTRAAVEFAIATAAMAVLAASTCLRPALAFNIQRFTRVRIDETRS